MYEDLKIILWPDPRLLKVSQPVTAFDENLHVLIARMFQLMRDSRGVGLAAPQVGVNLRLFIMNHTGQPADDRVYINPLLTEAIGDEEGEEGCLSLPGITVNIIRTLSLHMAARDPTGQPFEQTATGYVARIWQHETDHLDGKLLMDRMGPVDKLATRKTLRELQQRWDEAQAALKKKSR